MRPPEGWLAGHLPEVLREQDFLRRLLGPFEEVGGSVQARLDDVEYLVDVGHAPPEFLRWMAAWLGRDVPASLPEDRQRAVVRAAGSLWAWRGTARGVQGLLEAYTGGAVEVTDSGGVFEEGGHVPGPRWVRVRVVDGGDGLAEDQLATLVRAELPPDAELDLRVEAPPADEGSGT